MELFLSTLWAALQRYWPWLRWVLLVLAVLAAVSTFTQATDYLAARYAKHALGKKSNVLIEQERAAQQRDLRQRQRADSAYFVLQGQAQAARTQYLLHQRAYDSLAARLPTPPVLPAQPERYRAGAGRR